MFIEFKCPHCQAMLQDISAFAGKKSKCPRCKKEVIVPKKSKRSPEKAEVLKNLEKMFQ